MPMYEDRETHRERRRGSKARERRRNESIGRLYKAGMTLNDMYLVFRFS